MEIPFKMTVHFGRWKLMGHLTEDGPFSKINRSCRSLLNKKISLLTSRSSFDWKLNNKIFLSNDSKYISNNFFSQIQKTNIRSENCIGTVFRVGAVLWRETQIHKVKKGPEGDYRHTNNNDLHENIERTVIQRVSRIRTWPNRKYRGCSPSSEMGHFKISVMGHLKIEYFINLLVQVH